MTKLGRYEVAAEFTLRAEVDPSNEGQLDGVEYADGVEQYSDDSYFSSETTYFSGGAVTFVIEAEDAEAADRLANEIMRGAEWTEDSYEVDDYSISGIEELEAPEVEVSLLDAFALVHTVVARLVSQEQISAEEAAAFTVLINAIARVLADAPEAAEMAVG